MKIAIESTATTTSVEGCPVRLWEGVTEGGVRCKVFVRLVAVREEADRAAFDAELREVAAPRGELAIPLRMIL